MSIQTRQGIAGEEGPANAGAMQWVRDVYPAGLTQTGTVAASAFVMDGGEDGGCFQCYTK